MMEPYLGDICGEMPRKPRPNPWKSPQKLGLIERIIQTIVEILGILILAILLSIAVLIPFVTLARSAEIQYPVSIPSECVELAQRRGEPLMIENKRQGIRAKAKLYLLRPSEPGVKECVAAVRRFEQQLRNP